VFISTTKINLLKILELVTPILVFVSLAWWTWGAWPDAFVDFGRDVYNAWRISEGEVLYRDLAYFNGPLSPYFNASIFYIFGANLRNLFITNLMLLALFIIMTRSILLKITDRLTAWAGILATLSLFSFGQYISFGNYNFIAPYSHEATHGLILGLATLMCLWQWQKTSQFKWFILAGLLAGGAFMTKPETAFATLVSSMVMIFCTYFIKKDYSSLLREAALFIGISILPIITAILLLALAMSPAQAFLGVLSPWNLYFIKEIGAFTASGLIGTKDLAHNIKAIFEYFGWWILIFLPALILAKFTNFKQISTGSRGKVFLKKSIVPVAGILYLVALYVVFRMWGNLAWFEALRPLPLFLIVILIWFSTRFLRGIEPQQAIRVISLSVFSLIMLAKIIFNVHIYHYGFVLALPATLVLLSALISWIPSVLDSRGMNGNTIRVAGLVLLAVACFVYIDKTAALLSYKQSVVVSGPNTYRADIRGEFIKMAYNEIISNSKPDATLVVLPEGAMFNFLTYRRNPTPYSNFMPPLIKVWGEDNMINAFQKHPPDYIALFHKSAREIGYPFLGQDYGIKLMSWINQNYISLKVFGDKPLVPESYFGIEILKRASGQ
jgi:hypothetical protein